jgi:hypothetical protein
MNISLIPAELITYTLSIEDSSSESGVIMEILVTFHTGDTLNEEGLNWFKETLKADLDSIPLQERSVESILGKVRELLRETPFSHSYKLIFPEKPI